MNKQKKRHLTWTDWIIEVTTCSDFTSINHYRNDFRSRYNYSKQTRPSLRTIRRCTSPVSPCAVFDRKYDLNEHLEHLNVCRRRFIKHICMQEFYVWTINHLQLLLLWLRQRSVHTWGRVRAIGRPCLGSTQGSVTRVDSPPVFVCTAARYTTCPDSYIKISVQAERLSVPRAITVCTKLNLNPCDNVSGMGVQPSERSIIRETAIPGATLC